VSTDWAVSTDWLVSTDWAVRLISEHRPNSEHRLTNEYKLTCWLTTCRMTTDFWLSECRLTSVVLIFALVTRWTWQYPNDDSQNGNSRPTSSPWFIWIGLFTFMNLISNSIAANKFYIGPVLAYIIWFVFEIWIVHDFLALQWHFNHNFIFSLSYHFVVDSSI